MTAGNRLTGFRSSRSAQADDRCPAGITIAIGAAALIVTALVGAAFPPAPGPRLALLVVTVAAVAAVSGDGWAVLAVAGLAWAIGNGFLINRYGELSWHGRLDTGFVLSLLLGVSVGMVLSQISVERRAHRRMRPFNDLLRGDVLASGAAEPSSPGDAYEPEPEPQEAKER
jgi:hypothetical protein